jgi:hypothetical protein
VIVYSASLVQGLFLFDVPRLASRKRTSLAQVDVPRSPAALSSVARSSSVSLIRSCDPFRPSEIGLRPIVAAPKNCCNKTA